LNLGIFIVFTAALNRTNYLQLISPIFTLPSVDIEKTRDNIKKIIASYTPSQLNEDSSLIELFICLAPISSSHRRNLSHFEIILDIVNKHPNVVMPIIENYLQNSESYITQILWAEISVSQLDIFYSTEIYEIAKQFQNELQINNNLDLYQSINLFIENYKSKMIRGGTK